MSKRAKFSELPSGTWFEYNRRVYRKLRMNLAEDDDQMCVMFPSDVEVRTVQKTEAGPLAGDPKQVVRLDTGGRASAA